MIRYYEVYCDVEPKRNALTEANEQLREAKERLSGIVRKVSRLEATLQDLTSQYEEAVEEKVRCEAAADKTNQIISLANRLVNGLASEKIYTVVESEWEAVGGGSDEGWILDRHPLATS